MAASSTDRPRTLGMVLKGFPRISETFISNEIRLLEREGFNVHIYSMRAPRENFTHRSVRDIKARVTYLPESLLLGLPRLLWHNALLFARMPRRYLQGIRLMLSRFVGAPKKHTWLKHFLQAGYLVHRGMADEDVAHLHAHFAHTPTSVTLYAAHLADIPFSFTAHAKDIYTQSEERIVEKAERARFMVTCTRYNQHYLGRLVGGEEHVHCVYHGIDLSLFAPGEPNTAPKPPYHILSVARLVEKKGLPTVFAALKLLRERGIDFQYTLVGEGDDREKLTSMLDDMGLSDCTTLTGTMPHEEVLTHYRRADVFTLGCRRAKNGDRDGIPNVVAEALAMGVPVAATDFSGIPELVDHEETGLLCPSEDPEALADIIQRALTDRELRERIIPAGRRRVEELFDNVSQTKRLGDIFAAEGVPRDARVN